MKITNTIFKKTKIIATAGPTFETEERMTELFKKGVNVIRLNTSHGDIEEHQGRLDMAKKVREKLQLPVSILLDTKGPEIRIHEIKDGKMKVDIGQKLTIYSGKEILGQNNEFSVTYKDLLKTVDVGQIIKVDDGKLILKVIDKDYSKNAVVVESQNKYDVKTKKGVNIPDSNLTLPFISEYDKKIIKWGLKNDIDYVAASFVRDGKDVIELRKLLDNNGGKNVQIIPKIESSQAIRNLNEIIRLSDGIMLARGDLGVEIPYYEVPFYEKLIISKCRALGKPIIIATQMLDSMINSPSPTRAEVTDVYYAAISGTDATMLSGETASGNFPEASVSTMARINIEAEANYDYQNSYEQAYSYVDSLNADSAYLVARHALLKDQKYIFAFSEKGRLISALSRFRPNAIIIGLIKDKAQETKFGINYGVYLKHHNNQDDFKSDEKVSKIAISVGLKPGTKILVANKNEFRVIKVKS